MSSDKVLLSKALLRNQLQDADLCCAAARIPMIGLLNSIGREATRDAMGFVGKFSDTCARQLTASVFMVWALLAQACSIEQPVSGPVSLTSEWKTVEPPEPLRVGSKELQEVCVQVVGTATDVDFEKGRLLVNGQWHVLGGEAVDNEQTEYGLRVGSLGGDTVCLYRAGKPTSGPDFSPNLTIIRLRLRSEPPLQVAQVRWSSHDQM